MPRQPTTWLRVSAHRYLVRRTECALLGEAIYPTGPRARMPSASLAAGCVVTVLALAGCALLGLLSPHVALDRAQIVMSRDSGALFVRVGDVWHPVPNLASARLIAGSAADPQPIREADLERAKRGPLLGIPGAPQFVGRPLPAQELAFSMCDSDDASSTTVVVGPVADNGVTRMPPGQAVLAAVSSGSPAYLLYDGHRAIVDLEDAAVVRALRLEGHAPRLVSQALLNAMPEAPPISAPRIRGLGGAAPGLPGFRVGSVLRVTRADGDEYYAVLADGVQRIGQVAADLMRFGSSQGTVSPITVAPAAIRAAPVVAELPVAGFPDRAPTLPEAALLAGGRLPVPPGQAAVTLAQADGRGPALDAAYVPTGRSAYVRAGDKAGTRYLIVDTGVRFAIPDDDAAHDLGLSEPTPAPWPILTLLPAGPELSRRGASIARDAVAGSP
ncbi:type VII secretion protein EccB [Mycobacterium paraintracellulare]|uniref:type VII secretion protein EccB n=1 Tax=Mycobacterium paraintracellulare TaxID=1138383 RepID=UPI0019291D43|nr:type VII secretion protein EccB [Mycobacterium paraintracellulare]BCP17337.1 type VII secretion protein EccB [Mycobacterium paraintracellulare]